MNFTKLQWEFDDMQSVATQKSQSDMAVIIWYGLRLLTFALHVAKLAFYWPLKDIYCSMKNSCRLSVLSSMADLWVWRSWAETFPSYLIHMWKPLCAWMTSPVNQAIDSYTLPPLSCDLLTNGCQSNSWMLALPESILLSAMGPRVVRMVADRIQGY